MASLHSSSKTIWDFSIGSFAAGKINQAPYLKLFKIVIEPCSGPLGEERKRVVEKRTGGKKHFFLPNFSLCA
jgi:hypothetical protein